MKILAFSFIAVFLNSVCAHAATPWLDCREYKGSSRVVFSTPDVTRVITVNTGGNTRTASINNYMGSGYDESLYDYIQINESGAQFAPSKIDPVALDRGSYVPMVSNFNSRLLNRPIGEKFWAKGFNTYFSCTVKALVTNY